MRTKLLLIVALLMCATSTSLGMTENRMQGCPHRSGEALEVYDNATGIISLRFHYSFKGVIISLYKDGVLKDKQYITQVNKGDVYTFSTLESDMIIQVTTQDGKILLNENIGE